MPFDPTPVAFTALGFDARLLQGLAERSFVRTTPVQSGTIPLALEGADLIGCAATGTGKTAAFLLPIMQRFLANPATRRGTRALVLAPTRELAIQIEDEFHGLGYHTPLSAVAVYGGVPSGPQERALKAPADVIVATPGRLLDHMGCGLGMFDALEVLVLDEADRMLDMGFWPSVRRIIEALPAERQTLLFSATMSDEVLQAAQQIMREPKTLRVVGGGTPPGSIEHHAHRVDAGDKTTWLSQYLRRVAGPVLVFVRTKRGADRLARRLAASGVRCTALHADRTQSQRIAAVEGFRAGQFKALVATDIAARGLDIDGIEQVVNYDIPDTAEAYVHRVGRTGRAGATGTALTLLGADDTAVLKGLESTLSIRFAEPHATSRA